MAYTGKYIDRSPFVQPAGSSLYDPTESVGRCMTFMSLQEKLDAAIASEPKTEFVKKYKYPEQRQLYDPYCGDDTQVKALLSLPKPTSFQALEGELKETAYTSYWRKELGTLPDQIPGLPYGMVPEKAIFGKPTPRGLSVREVVNPNITTGEVNLIAELGHELYRKSHNGYSPGEQKLYNYATLPNPKNNLYGSRNNLDTAVKVSDILQCDNKDYIIGPKNLAKYKEQNTQKVGKSTEKSDHTFLLPEGYAYGQAKPKNEGNVQELFGCAVTPEKQLLLNAVSYLYQLRRSIRSRYPPFSFVELAGAYRNEDENQCECIPLRSFYEISQKEGLKLNEELINPVLRRLNILHGQKNLVNYIRFIHIIDSNEPFPDVGKIESGELMAQSETVYQSILSDANRDRKCDVPPAGEPIARLRYKYHHLTDKRLVKANYEDYPTSTTVENCLSPGLFPSLGVSHKDFFRPRTKEYIRGLYERINIKFPDDIFETLWKEAIRRDGERVCLETFRNILDEITTIQLLEGAEI